MGDVLPSKNYNSNYSLGNTLVSTAMLNTHQRALLDMPTTLADLFEFLSSCNLDSDGHEIEPYTDKDIIWTFFSFLKVHDIMKLRQVCRSTA